MLKIKDIMKVLENCNSEAYVDLNVEHLAGAREDEKILYVMDRGEEVCTLYLFTEGTFAHALMHKLIHDNDLKQHFFSRSAVELCEEYQLEEKAFATLISQCKLAITGPIGL